MMFLKDIKNGIYFLVVTKLKMKFKSTAFHLIFTTYMVSCRVNNQNKWLTQHELQVLQNCKTSVASSINLWKEKDEKRPVPGTNTMASYEGDKINLFDRLHSCLSDSDRYMQICFPGFDFSSDRINFDDLKVKNAAINMFQDGLCNKKHLIDIEEYLAPLKLNDFAVELLYSHIVPYIENYDIEAKPLQQDRVSQTILKIIKSHLNVTTNWSNDVLPKLKKEILAMASGEVKTVSDYEKHFKGLNEAQVVFLIQEIKSEFSFKGARGGSPTEFHNQQLS